VLDVLPAVHTLSGYDSTIKIATKHAALKAAKEFPECIKKTLV